jgi:rare lipoprotein A
MYFRAFRLFFLPLLVLTLAACATTAPGSPATKSTRASEPFATTPAVAPEVGIAPHASLPPSLNQDVQPLPSGDGLREFQRGGASWYGPRFNGRRTASGERYDMHAFTAAHRTLPFGTVVRVRSLINGREVDVRINDRGPRLRSRIIDVSRAAADALGMLTVGVKDVVLLVPDSIETPPELPPRLARKTNRAARAR